ncbi:putative pentatricopeptide [Lupinus albus]|uniref:Putative pentatricopeptide n=1 Tax=Lupinus albus TaxID=3870 RepID=A0A6A4N9Q3_LUPAL|nr:putative pentatricopeptide [Lupinus albus]
MIQRGIHTDVWSYNILINCLFKLVKPDEANRTFMDIVLGEFCPSPVMYNVMINGLCKNGYVNNALALFRNLQWHGFIPQILTYNALINGLCKSRRMGATRKIPFCLQDFGFLFKMWL